MSCQFCKTTFCWHCGGNSHSVLHSLIPFCQYKNYALRLGGVCLSEAFVFLFLIVFPLLHLIISFMIAAYVIKKCFRCYNLNCNCCGKCGSCCEILVSLFIILFVLLSFIPFIFLIYAVTYLPVFLGFIVKAL